MPPRAGNLGRVVAGTRKDTASAEAEVTRASIRPDQGRTAARNLSMSVPFPRLAGMAAPDSEPTTDDAASARPLERHAEERTDPTLLATVLGEDRTRVLDLRDGTAPILESETGPRLKLRAPRAGDDPDRAFFLGRDDEGRAWVALEVAEAAEAPDAPQQDARTALSARVPASAVPATPGPGERPDPPETWSGLRDVGAQLGPRDVDAYMTAVALTNWHRTHRFCPRCGAPTKAVLAGWVRRCERDGTEHYPRTDPAVIMAVIDEHDRLLLARNAAWPLGRRSVLAGFVEPGERLEAAVAREVSEEVGVLVDDVTYCDSQPWPFPASLMLGFTARARSGDLRVDADEIVEAEWYTRERLAAAVADGSLGLPGRLSIARRLLELWYGEPIVPPVEVAFHRPS